MKYSNIPLISSVAMDANVESAKIDCNQIVKMSAQIVTVENGGTIDGAIQLQVSNDICPYGGPTADQFVPTNWSNLGSSVALSATGAAIIAQQDMCYRWLRAVYTDSASTSEPRLSVNLMVLSI
jgi:hypothetical protein